MNAKLANSLFLENITLADARSKKSSAKAILSTGKGQQGSLQTEALGSGPQTKAQGRGLDISKAFEQTLSKVLPKQQQTKIQEGRKIVPSEVQQTQKAGLPTLLRAKSEDRPKTPIPTTIHTDQDRDSAMATMASSRPSVRVPRPQSPARPRPVLAQATPDDTLNVKDKPKPVKPKTSQSTKPVKIEVSVVKVQSGAPWVQSQQGIPDQIPVASTGSRSLPPQQVQAVRDTVARARTAAKGHPLPITQPTVQPQTRNPKTSQVADAQPPVPQTEVQIQTQVQVQGELKSVVQAGHTAIANHDRTDRPPIQMQSHTLGQDGKDPLSPGAKPVNQASQETEMDGSSLPGPIQTEPASIPRVHSHHDTGSVQWTEDKTVPSVSPVSSQTRTPDMRISDFGQPRPTLEGAVTTSPTGLESRVRIETGQGQTELTAATEVQGQAEPVRPIRGHHAGLGHGNSGQDRSGAADLKVTVSSDKEISAQESTAATAFANTLDAMPMASPGFQEFQVTVRTEAPVADQIVGSIQATLQEGTGRITIELNPPELGRVVVRFEQKDDQIVGRIEVDNPDTRLEIERALPEMVDRLQDSGIQVRTLDIAYNNPDQERGHRDQFLWQDQGRHPGQDRRGDGHPGELDSGRSANQAPVSTAEPVRHVAVGDGLINMLA